MPALDLGLVLVRSRAEFEPVRRECDDRLAYEAALAESGRSVQEWTIAGFCQPCGAAVDFQMDWKYSDGRTPNWRERLLCPRCGLNNRQRFAAHLVGEHAAGTVYLYEQVTAFSRWAAAQLPDVVGSEYLGHEFEGGTVVNGLRHEDALALSFADASLSAIVSNDVFEHVPDADRALAEAARVLEPGGRLLFSIPFVDDLDATVQRAELRDGEVVEPLPPVYHGNPLSEQGSLVFFDYGWDLLDRCRAAGFADAHVTTYWSPLYGYLGGGLQLAFAAVR